MIADMPQMPDEGVGLKLVPHQDGHLDIESSRLCDSGRVNEGLSVMAGPSNLARHRQPHLMEDRLEPR